MKLIRRRRTLRCRMPFGCEPLEARLQFAGDLTFDTSVSPSLRSALDHAIIARGNTTAHVESSSLGLVLELTGTSGALVSVAADAIPATITGVQVLDVNQFSISGTRTFAFLDMDTVALAKVTGVQVQYSLYADNVGVLQADAHQNPVTVAGTGPTIFYSTAFDQATVLSSDASLTLTAPAAVGSLSLVLLEPSAQVHVGFRTGSLTIYGGLSTQVDQVTFGHGYVPPTLETLTSTAHGTVTPPDPVVSPPVSDPGMPATGTDAPPVTVGGTETTPPPVTVPDPVVVAPPVVTVPPPVATMPPPVEVAPPPVEVTPPPVASTPPPPVVVVTPPPAVPSATDDTFVPDALRALVYLASLNLLSFDDQTRTHIGLLLGRAGTAGVNDSVTLKANPTALDTLDYRRGAETLLRDGLASHRPAVADGLQQIAPLTLNTRVASGRQLDFVPLSASAVRTGDRAAGGPVPTTGREIHLPVPRPSGAENAAQRTPLFAGEAYPAASSSPATVFLSAAPLQALGELLTDRLQAEFTPGERAAVLISEARLAGSSLHG